jgi:hypothetical protein
MKSESISFSAIQSSRRNPCPRRITLKPKEGHFRVRPAIPQRQHFPWPYL